MSKAFVFGAVLVSLVGCSSGGGTGGNMMNNPTPQYTGDDPATAHPGACAAMNANGDCYPTSNIGYYERRGSTPGNKIPNLHFYGYKNTTPGTMTASSGDMQQIQLADFYDPSGSKYKIIRIVVAALWCGPCNQEADFIVQNSIATDLASQGVVMLQAIVEGNVPGNGAVPGDLSDWVNKHKLNFSAALDGNDKFGLFWKQDAIPENFTVDARSMEILAKEAGFSSNVKNDLQSWVTWTMTNPPQK